jgi:antirestriction protein ArdC
MSWRKNRIAPYLKRTTEQHRKEFVEKIVDLMEQGEAPWQRPWKLPPSCMSINAVSGKRYNGNNMNTQLTFNTG